MSNNNKKNNTIFKKLFKFSTLIKPITKDSDSEINNKTYNYISLQKIQKSIKNILIECELYYTQSIINNELILTVYDTEGNTLTSSYPLFCVDPTNPQIFGSTLTYAKRYQLIAFFGLIIEEKEETALADTDDDGKLSADSTKNIKKYIVQEQMIDELISKNDINNLKKVLETKYTKNNELIIIPNNIKQKIENYLNNN